MTPAQNSSTNSGHTTIPLPSQISCALRASIQTSLEKFQETKSKAEDEKHRLEKMEFKDDALQIRLQSEQQRLTDQEKERQHLKQDQYNKGQILFEEKRTETEFMSGISGIAAQDKNMRSKILDIDEEVSPQTLGYGFRCELL